ncbi:hypothetical protein [Coleofasciculus chthonoplastes]|uniref:hypothetical protein n=1 Tax=Coleofasciculus chthonoplastes TaxID=64178 RepID=UPI0032F1F178
MSEDKNEQYHDQKSKFAESIAEPVLKYPQPKILLLDMEEEAEKRLKAVGYHVTVGSFGRPYKVDKSDNVQPIITNEHLPWNLSEQEIVVIDLLPNELLDQVQGEKHTSPGENDWWASCSEGVIDPRPRSMLIKQKSFDRILEHGGVFIIFADIRRQQKQFWGHIINYGTFIEEEKLPFDNWCFLSILDPRNLDIKVDLGQEISVAIEFAPLSSTLREHTEDAKFFCTLEPKYQLQESWLPLAKNKYGSTVAATICTNSNESKGWIFILPHPKDKPSFLVRFLNEVLPSLLPNLFPYTEGSHWVQKPDYEFPKVLELKSRIQEIQDEARKQILKLEEAIEQERMEMAYLHDLIKETGTPLVNAVKKTLKVLGFQSVKDVDEEMEKTGQTYGKCEDLQIHETSPVLLVEVKGISGLPTDADSFQVTKHIVIRMKEWDRTDVAGLTIFNHQKNLPPLDRENHNTFRQTILDNAEGLGFGLLTTWDLFRLTRNYLKHGWTHEQVRDVFYRHGHIEPIPTHYEFIGVIEHFWEKAEAVGVRIQSSLLQQGDWIAFEFSVEFEEQEVVSLQEDRKPVQQVSIEGLAGIKTHFTKDKMKKNVRVFRLLK